eukprot:4777448-Alexandrium_andersonii.AAC.1
MLSQEPILLQLLLSQSIEPTQFSMVCRLLLLGLSREGLTSGVQPQLLRGGKLVVALVGPHAPQLGVFEVG